MARTVGRHGTAPGPRGSAERCGPCVTIGGFRACGPDRTRPLEDTAISDDPLVEPDASAGPPAGDPALPSSDPGASDLLDGPLDRGFVWEDDGDDEEEDAKWGLGTDAAVVGTGAPPVVAVVVARDPGGWFDDTLRSLGRQEYAELSVVVVDNASAEPLAGRVTRVLPDATVVRRESDRGFAAAANAGLDRVGDAPFLLVCHDDVVLGRDAVTAMVAEAFRANAGIVGAKLVDWRDPSILSSVGLGVDDYGASAELVDAGELDQSQHDQARNVFAVSTACMLVRTDLFRTMGGFREDIPTCGEDVDLCWRTLIAGASVQFCPRAVVRHRRRYEDRRPIDRDRLAIRHETRMVLANVEFRRAWYRLPASFLLALADVIASVVLGRFRRAGDDLAALAAGIAGLPRAFSVRRSIRRYRRTHDRDLQPLVHRGSYRLASLVRTDEGQSRLAVATEGSRGYLRDLTTTDSRAATALVIAALVVVVVGTRKLFGGDLPVLREFVDASQGTRALLGEWWTAWRGAGLGESAVPPPVVPGLGIVSAVLLGRVELARRLLVLAPLLIGGLGAWKLFARAGSSRARAVAFASYVLAPVMLNALGSGRLQALWAWAIAPWFLRRVATRAGVAPFAVGERRLGGWFRHVAGNALLLVVVGAVSPAGAALVAVSAVLFAVAPFLAGERRGAVRMVVATLAGSVLAAAVLSPWLVESFRTGDLTSVTGIWFGRAPAPSATEVVTGSIGPVTFGYLGWGMLVAALVPLVTGRAWRTSWAFAGWLVALTSWAGTLALVQRGDFAGAGVELTLVPAALGLTVAVSMVAFAFDVDVVGSDFGFRQVLSGIGALALVIALVPALVAASDGRWYLPQGDYQRALDLVAEGDDFRTLWIGDADVLPLAGWELTAGGGLAFGLSEGFEPTVTQRYRLDGGPGVQQVDRALSAALVGGTARLGQALAPMGIRYVLLVDRPAPEPFAPLEVPPPAGTESALREQLDLTQIPLAPGASLFRVEAAWPLRSDVTSTELAGGGEAGLAEQLAAPPVPAPPAVLGLGPGTSFEGDLVEGTSVAQAVTGDPGWSLTVGGDTPSTATRSDLFGWGQRFEVAGTGPSTLAWSTPTASRGLQAAQALVLLVLLALVIRRRPSEPTRRARNVARPVDLDDPVPTRRRRVERPVEDDVGSPWDESVAAGGESVGDGIGLDGDGPAGNGVAP